MTTENYPNDIITKPTLVVEAKKKNLFCIDSLI